MKLKYIIWSILLLSTGLHSQSFLVTINNDTIICSNISRESGFLSSKIKLEYQIESSSEKKQIELSKVKGYYLDEENVFYEYKNEFAELVVEGKINLYRGIEGTYGSASAPTMGSGGVMMGGGYGIDSGIYDWYVIKGASFEKVLSIADSHKSIINNKILKELISDDKKAIEELKNVKKRGIQSQVLKIINDYNIRQFEKNKKSKIEMDTDFADILLFRGYKKETKNFIQFSVNGVMHKFERNSKMKFKIPSNNLTEICIENSINKYCTLVSSSLSFPKFYRLKLNKKNEGYIEKVNGNSLFLKRRFEYYDELVNKK